MYMLILKNKKTSCVPVTCTSNVACFGTPCRLPQIFVLLHVDPNEFFLISWFEYYTLRYRI
jgi:hypothetical protein